jgi:putative hydrolase of the HAD superfamily
VDVYETLVTCDFARHRSELPQIAGVPPGAWAESFARIGPELTVGRLSMAMGFEHILDACGVTPRPALVRELVRKDEELLLASARLFDDAIPFLEVLRSRGMKIAIVSNCTHSTRPLLFHLGVPDLVDSLVLSFEVGWAKPSAEIYEDALGQLGASADAAIFVDDQPAYCGAAVALGISTAQIVRGDAPDPAPVPGITLVRSLRDVEPLL